MDNFGKDVARQATHLDQLRDIEKTKPSDGLRNEIHGLEVNVQDGINNLVDNPIPGFPPSIGGKPGGSGEGGWGG